MLDHISSVRGMRDFMDYAYEVFCLPYTDHGRIFLLLIFIMVKVSYVVALSLGWTVT